MLTLVVGALLGCTAVLAYPMAMPYPAGPMANPDPYAMPSQFAGPMPNQFAGPFASQFGPMAGPDALAFNFGGPIASADPYASANPYGYPRAQPGPQPNANPFAFAQPQPDAFGAPNFFNF